MDRWMKEGRREGRKEGRKEERKDGRKEPHEVAESKVESTAYNNELREGLGILNHKLLWCLMIVLSFQFLQVHADLR